MTIDGIDIQEYGAVQHSVTPGYIAYSNSSEWVEGALNPIWKKSTTGFQVLQICLLMKGTDRNAIWENGSRLLAKLQKQTEIQCDGFDHYFTGVLKNVEQAEVALQRWHKMTLKFEGYKHGRVNVVSCDENTKSFTVENLGTLETPVRMQLIPSIGKVSLTIQGLTRDRLGNPYDLIINNLSKGKSVIIDGESGLITEEGINKYPDVKEIWSMPSLMPGMNQITLSQDGVKVIIEHKPRYI